MRNSNFEADLSFLKKKCFISGTSDTRMKQPPSVATIDDPEGKSKWKEIFKPAKLPKRLTSIAIMTTALFERARIIAHTDGIIR